MAASTGDAVSAAGAGIAVGGHADGVNGADRLKVLVLSNGFPSPGAPARGAFVREHARIAARRHDVVVVCDGGRGGSPRRPYRLSDGVEDGIRVVRVRHVDPRMRPVPGLAYRAGVWAAVRGLMRQGFRPDLIHAHFYNAGVIALWLRRVYGVPFLISEFSSPIARRTLTRWERFRARRVLGSADAVCPGSDAMSRAIAGLTSCRMVRIVPYAVDEDVFHPPEPDLRAVRRSDGARMLLVAMLAPVKGVEDLLRAVAGARRRAPGLALEIVGDGPLADPLRRLAVDLGVDGAVRFHGALPKPQVADIMRRCDFLALASHAETQGVVLIEAMACGLPIVATGVGAIPEFVGRGEGLIVPAGDVEALAEALVAMAGSHADYDRTQIARRARERFGYPAIGARLEVVYRELLT